MSVTQLKNNAEKTAYVSANPGAWLLAMRQEIRVCPPSMFTMDLDKFTHLHQCYAVPSESDIGQLAAIALNDGRGRPYSRGFRQPQVIDAFKKLGIELTADTRLGSGSGRGRSVPAVSAPMLSPDEEYRQAQRRIADEEKALTERKALLAEKERIAREAALAEIAAVQAKHAWLLQEKPAPNAENKTFVSTESVESTTPAITAATLSDESNEPRRNVRR